MRNSSYTVLVTAAACLLVAGKAAAQQDPAQALARAQSLLRQVSAQKQELEVANARMAAELAALEKQADRAEASLKETSLDLESEQRQMARTSQTLERTQERLARTEDNLREAIERLRNTNAELRDTSIAKADLEARLAATEAELADSERKNMDLYLANVELLELYEKKGPFTSIFQREPVTGIKNVQIQNTLQEYQVKLDDSLRDSNRDAIAAEQDGQNDD